MMKWVKVACLGTFGLYVLSYAYARVAVFHAVEDYAGKDGKSGLRQDYIAKRDQPAGVGWEYHLFWLPIQAEERLLAYVHNRPSP
jgi:hypothetical protein